MSTHEIFLGHLACTAFLTKEFQWCSVQQTTANFFSLNFLKWLMVDFFFRYALYHYSVVEANFISASVSWLLEFADIYWYPFIIYQWNVSCATGCHTSPRHNRSTLFLLNASPFFLSIVQKGSKVSFISSQHFSKKPLAYSFFHLDYWFFFIIIIIFLFCFVFFGGKYFSDDSAM